MAGGPTIAPNALPNGGKVVAGNASISSNSTGQSATMNVNQSSQKAIINWNGFNVGANAAVNFNQPNAQAVTLNRVTSGSASVINGAIRANGQVVLVNSNGIAFGRGAQVDAPGFVASTLDLANKEFMAGKNTYIGDGKGKIINEGTIRSTVEGGYIALLAPEVRNHGYLIAQKGSTVAIAAGKQITLNFQGQSLISLKVDEGVYNGLIENKHAIEAPGGLVILAAGDANQLMASVINNAGTISASSAINNGGVIEIVAANVTQAGTLSASAIGATGQGGQINLVGKNISLEANSNTSATGTNGGGQINIGLGNTQVTGGSQTNSNNPSSLSASQAQILSANNANLANQNNLMAETVSIQPGAVIDTSATQRGNGGMIAIWSQLKTTVAGILQSMGGVISGNGGFIETSSRGQVNVTSLAQINTSAPNGNVGTWLLDPIDLVINSTGANAIGLALANNNVIIDVNSATVCSVSGVCAATATAVGGSGNLTLGADIIKMGQTLTTLTLTASGIFNLNANIIGQNLNVVINSSIAFLNVGTRIEATTVTVKAVNSITTSGVIQALYQYLGSSSTTLGNLIELMAQAIYVNGALLVSTTESRAGKIKLNANQITINPGATIFASGQSGGEITIVSTGTFDDQGVIKANGMDSGGTISITSTRTSNYSGADVKANGDQNGGSITLTASAGDLNLNNSGVLAQGINGAGGAIAINGQIGVSLSSSSIISDGMLSGGNISIQSNEGRVRLTSTLVQSQSGNNSLGGMGGAITLAAMNNQITLAESDLVAHGYTGTGSISIGGVSTHDVLTHDQFAGIDPLSIVDASQYVAGRVNQVTGVLADRAIVYLQPPPNLLASLNPQRLTGLQGPSFGPQPGPQQNDFATTFNNAMAKIFGPPPGSISATEGGVRGSTTSEVEGANPRMGPPGSSPQGTPPQGVPTSTSSGQPPTGNQPVGSNSVAQDGTKPPPPPPAKPPYEGKYANGLPSNSTTQDGSKPPPPPPAKPPYEGKYANGLPSTNTANAKPPPPPPAKPPYEGKYAQRIQALNSNPPARPNAYAANDPFHAMMGLPAQANAPIVGPVPFPTSASDGLSASYDSLPSTRNSGINHVGQSHLSNAYKESLESTNLTATMNLLIGL